MGTRSETMPYIQAAQQLHGMCCFPEAHRSSRPNARASRIVMEVPSVNHKQLHRGTPLRDYLDICHEWVGFCEFKQGSAQRLVDNRQMMCTNMSLIKIHTHFGSHSKPISPTRQPLAPTTALWTLGTFCTGKQQSHTQNRFG